MLVRRVAVACPCCWTLGLTTWSFGRDGAVGWVVFWTFAVWKRWQQEMHVGKGGTVQAWAALAVFGAGNVIEDVGPSTYMSRNCIDGLVVKLRLSSFGGLLGAAAAAGVVSEVVLSWLGSGKRGNWWKISHRTRCGRVGNSVVRLVTGL